jgi:hypothetical protein
MKNNPLIVRVDDEKKTLFKIFLLRRNITMQSLIEHIIDALVAFDNGEKNVFIDKLLKKIRNES